MTPDHRSTIDVPGPETSDEFVTAFNVLLHELRTPLSVAQGYLRLLLEDRLDDPGERQRAITQSMEALGRMSALCATAGEFANSAGSVDAQWRSAAELIDALELEAREKGVRIDIQASLPAGRVRTVPPRQAAAAIVTVLQSALGRHPASTLQISVSFDATDLRVASGDARAWAEGPGAGAVMDPWRSGFGLSLPLASKRLTEGGARVRVSAADSTAVSIAFPVEWQA